MLKNTHIHKALILLTYFQFVTSVTSVTTILGKNFVFFILPRTYTYSVMIVIYISFIDIYW